MSSIAVGVAMLVALGAGGDQIGGGGGTGIRGGERAAVSSTDLRERGSRGPGASRSAGASGIGGGSSGGGGGSGGGKFVPVQAPTGSIGKPPSAPGGGFIKDIVDAIIGGGGNRGEGGGRC